LATGAGTPIRLPPSLTHSRARLRSPALLQALADGLLQQRRDHGLDGGDRRRLLLEDRGDEARLARALEGAPAGGHLVEQRPEGEDVAARVGLLALELLGRHVVHGPDDRAVGGQGRGERQGAEALGFSLRDGQLGQPEVQQLGALARDHDVARLEVAVHQAPAVGGVQGVGDLDRVPHHVGGRDRTPDQPRGQGLALEMLHHQVVVAVLLADVEEGADVRMIQAADGLGLALEPFLEVGAGGGALGQDLDGDRAFQARVAGAVDLAHASGADLGLDLVGAERLSWFQAHGFPRRDGRRWKGTGSPGSEPRISKLKQTRIFK